MPHFFVSTGTLNHFRFRPKARAGFKTKCMCTSLSQPNLKNSLRYSMLLFCSLTVGMTVAQTEGHGRRILVLSENKGHHVRYTHRATLWLNQLAADSALTIDYIQNTDPIDDTLLSRYQLFIQLDYPPYGWSKTATEAFEKYMKHGKGSWMGFHHASLLGEFDGYPLWNWFSDFMGGVRYKNYIASFATATVIVEDQDHPVMRGMPPAFTIYNEEWYTYDHSPRNSVHVLAHVDESSYVPDSSIKMGDHPVIWSNPTFATRNLYIFMGHSPDLFDNPAYTQLFRNAIFWSLAGR